MAEGIKSVEPFDPTGEPSVIAAKWERWKKSFNFFDKFDKFIFSFDPQPGGMRGNKSYKQNKTFQYITMLHVEQHFGNTV